MFSFANDYSEGACPEVLDALTRTNHEQCPGYGEDEHCKNAAQLIKQIIERDDVDVHFIPGGTPANVLGIARLNSYEAVICATNGHINTHETGAVEATGHKIIEVEAVDGKVTAAAIEKVMSEYTDEHMVKPKMVFVSNSSEFGTIYTKQELTDISNTCKKHGLYLYLDGARLSNALVAVGNDLRLKDIANLVDMFYIGGTKNGCLLGEAMIIVNDDLKKDFRYSLKQHGSMLAKGRIIGAQFEALMKDNLYLKNAENANVMAQALKYIFKQFNVPQYIDSPTNQIFVVLDNRLVNLIKQNFIITIWGKYDESHTIVRFVCSWATKKSDIEDFYNYFTSIVNSI